MTNPPKGCCEQCVAGAQQDGNDYRYCSKASCPCHTPQQEKIEDHLNWQKGHNCPVDDEGLCDGCPCHQNREHPKTEQKCDCNGSKHLEHAETRTLTNPYVKPTDASWEEEFDQKYLVALRSLANQSFAEHIKAFIRKVRETSYKQGWDDALNGL